MKSSAIKLSLTMTMPMTMTMLPQIKFCGIAPHGNAFWRQICEMGEMGEVGEAKHLDHEQLWFSKNLESQPRGQVDF